MPIIACHTELHRFSSRTTPKYHRRSPVLKSMQAYSGHRRAGKQY